MKRIILTDTFDGYHFELAKAIGKAAGMQPKQVIKAGLELLYKELKEKQQREGGPTNDARS